MPVPRVPAIVDLLSAPPGRDSIMVGARLQWINPADAVATLMAPLGGPIPLPLIPQLDLETHTVAAIDARLAGLTASDTTKKLYSSINHGTSAYVRNPACWAAGLDLTGVAIYNSQFGAGTIGVTAITPRHVVSPHHAGGTGVTGGTVRFVQADGTVITRTVVAHARVGTTDIHVGKLDSDLPETIRPLRLMPANARDIMDLAGLAVLILDQEGKALVYDTTAVTFDQINALASPNAQRAAFFEPFVGGDSGFPWFLVFDQEPVLVSTSTGGGDYPASGPIYSDYIEAINAVLTSLGGGYQVATRPIQERPLHWRHILSAPAITTLTASVSPTAGQVVVVQTDGKIKASLIPAGVGLTGSLGGNGAADSGKAALYSSVGGLTAAADTDYAAVAGSNNRTSGSTSYCAGVSGAGNVVGVLGTGVASGAIGVHGTGSGLGVVANTSGSGNIFEARKNDGVKLAVANDGSLVWSTSGARTATIASLGLGSMSTQSAAAVAITGGSVSGVTVTSDLLLADSGSSRDIRLTGNTSFFRIMATSALSSVPSGAALQFGGNASGLPGQIYLDSGADNSAAIIFRTSTSGVAATERMRIAANGQVTISSLFHLTPQAPPGSPTEGDVYASSSDHHLYFYNGSSWKQLDN